MVISHKAAEVKHWSSNSCSNVFAYNPNFNSRSTGSQDAEVDTGRSYKCSSLVQPSQDITLTSRVAMRLATKPQTSAYRVFAVNFFAFKNSAHLTRRLSAPGYATSSGRLFPWVKSVAPSFSNLATAVAWDPSDEFNPTLGLGRSLRSLFMYLQETTIQQK